MEPVVPVVEALRVEEGSLRPVFQWWLPPRSLLGVLVLTVEARVCQGVPDEPGEERVERVAEPVLMEAPPVDQEEVLALEEVAFRVLLSPR